MMDPEDKTRQLWVAVITQALEDATPIAVINTPYLKKVQEREKREAREWLAGNSKDFRNACHLANIDPDWLRAKAIESFKAYDATPLTDRRKEQRPAPAIRPKPKPVTYTHAGETLTLAEWAQRYGLTVDAIKRRLNRGWGIERALTTSLEQGRKDAARNFAQVARPKSNAGRKPVTTYEHEGLSLSITEWAQRKGMSMRTLRNRLFLGWTFERAITEPVRIKGAELVAIIEQPDRGAGSRLHPKAPGPARTRNNRAHEIEISENQDLAA